VDDRDRQPPEELVLLHGFGGTRRTWDGVIGLLDRERYRPLALDLPGHGELAGAPPPITFDACVERVLAAAPPRTVLCGYSLGGRVALHVALAAPGRVARLVLVSATAGIDDEAERAARRAADGALAAALEQRPFAEFIARWSEQPVFAHDPPAVHAAMRAEQLRNRPAALAAALRGIGTGEMAPLWGRLGELTMPVAVLVGERDRKFHAPGRRLAELLPDARLRIVPGGHRLPLENPEALARALAGQS
jgi:2-succinyl-6-hydroxy-2,4-cyclohexadiene-1-carboxylate synthase